MKPNTVQWIKGGFIPVLILLSGLCHAQVRISGKVTDSATSKPMADVSVYIANSTIGAKTDQNGGYSFSNLSPGSYEIIASSVGYKARQAALTVKSGEVMINISLAPRSIELNEVTINAGDWKRNLVKFKNEFIGTTIAQECSVLNPDILDLNFDYKNNRLTASTTDFLEIQNNKLGYKLRFLIKDFSADYNTMRCHYSGSVVFEELQGKKADQKKWVKNRQETYNGSLRHFLTSLYMGSLAKDKFLVRVLTRELNTARPSDSLLKKKINYFSSRYRAGEKHALDSMLKWSNLRKLPKLKEELSKNLLQETDLVKDTSTPDSYPLQFPGYIYVVYRNKSVDMDYDDLFRFEPQARDNQISALSLKNPARPTLFNSKGLLLTNESLLFEGAWDSRIIDLLPFDYVPAAK